MGDDGIFDGNFKEKEQIQKKNKISKYSNDSNL